MAPFNTPLELSAATFRFAGGLSQPGSWSITRGRSLAASH
jgi:hypothetical protein